MCVFGACFGIGPYIVSRPQLSSGLGSVSLFPCVCVCLVTVDSISLFFLVIVYAYAAVYLFTWLCFIYFLMFFRFSLYFPIYFLFIRLDCEPCQVE